MSSEDLTGENYLSDDEEFLVLELDEVIGQDNEYGVFQQLDNVVSWQVKNFYKDNGKPKNRFKMRKEPPIFEISDSAGNSADFILSKELSESLSHVFNDVMFAYYGVDNTRRRKDYNRDKDIITRVAGFISDHPLQSGLIVAVFLFLIISVVL